MWDARAQALPRAPRGGRPSRVRGRGPAEAPGIPTLGCTRRGSSEGPGRGGLAGEAPRASGRSRPLPCPPLPAALRAPGRAPPHARPPAGGGWSRPGLQGSGFWPRPNSPTLQRTEHTPAEHGEPAAAGGFRSSPPPPPPVAAERPGAGVAQDSLRLGSFGSPPRTVLGSPATSPSAAPAAPGKARVPAEAALPPSPAPAQTRRRGTGGHAVRSAGPGGARAQRSQPPPRSPTPQTARRPLPLPRRPLTRSPRKQPLETEFPGGFLTRGRQSVGNIRPAPGAGRAGRGRRRPRRPAPRAGLRLTALPAPPLGTLPLPLPLPGGDVPHESS